MVYPQLAPADGNTRERSVLGPSVRLLRDTPVGLKFLRDKQRCFLVTPDAPSVDWRRRTLLTPLRRSRPLCTESTSHVNLPAKGISGSVRRCAASTTAGTPPSPDSASARKLPPTK